MNENEKIVGGEAEQTIEQPAEQTTETAAPKTFTQDEVNEIVSKREARTRAKIEKEYQRKYGGLEEVLRAGTGKESVEEMTDTFQKFYASKGIKLPEKPSYSAKDVETLARADAEDIIRSGFEDVVEEVDRLAALGVSKMTPREKALFKQLAEYRQGAERGHELSKLGVTEDVYNGAEFKAFASKFNANTPIREIYDIYSKSQPRKEIKPMGSMKSNDSSGGGVKDFYSFEEAKKFTNADYDKTPGLEAAVKASMPKWRK